MISNMYRQRYCSFLLIQLSTINLCILAHTALHAPPEVASYSYDSCKYSHEEHGMGNIPCLNLDREGALDLSFYLELIENKTFKI